jgi:hypothetical protein
MSHTEQVAAVTGTGAGTGSRQVTREHGISGVVDSWGRKLFYQRGGDSWVIKLALQYRSGQGRPLTGWERLGTWGVWSLVIPLIWLDTAVIRIFRKKGKHSDIPRGSGGSRMETTPSDDTTTSDSESETTVTEFSQGREADDKILNDDPGAVPDELVSLGSSQRSRGLSFEMALHRLPEMYLTGTGNQATVTSAPGV